MHGSVCMRGFARPPDPTREIERPRSLEYPRAGALGGGRKAQRVAQRMQVSAARIVQRGDVAARLEHRAHFLARHVARRRVSESIPQRGLERAQLGVVAGVDRDLHVAARPLALDSVARDELSDEIDTFDGDVPNGARDLGPREPFELDVAGRRADEHLAAAPPRGAPADAVLLEQHNPIAALGKVQRGRAPCDAAAYDANVAAHLPGQRGPRRGSIRRGLVVGTDAPKEGHDGASTEPAGDERGAAQDSGATAPLQARKRRLLTQFRIQWPRSSGCRRKPCGDVAQPAALWCDNALPMSLRRPVIGLPADRRMIGLHPFHAVGERYIRAVVEAAGAIPFLIPSLGEALDPDAVLDRVDGILFTGSPSNVEPRHYGGPPSAPGTLHDPHRDATTLPLIPGAIAAGVPVLGICRGFQEMNVAFGGTLHQRVHEVPGLMDHRDDESQPLEAQFGSAHDVLLEPGGLLRQLAGTDRVRVNSLHSQGVERLGHDLAIEARAPDGLVEAFRVRSAKRFAVAVQWHPEWQVMSNTFSRAIFAAFGAASLERAQLR